ncbi:putative RNA-directed DNA polymerase from transposon BS [Varanus komodoensis]|nr:putative RNA-directed DNA polymerase from transposon BS [Varanus komodoensis]
MSGSRKGKHNCGISEPLKKLMAKFGNPCCRTTTIKLLGQTKNTEVSVARCVLAHFSGSKEQICTYIWGRTAHATGALLFLLSASVHSAETKTSGAGAATLEACINKHLSQKHHISYTRAFPLALVFSSALFVYPKYVDVVFDYGFEEEYSDRMSHHQKLLQAVCTGSIDTSLYILSELTETVSDLVLRTPRMLVLGDFNLHAESGLTGAAQDFMASMTAMGLSQHVIGPTHERGHTLDLVFSTGQEEDDLRVRNLCLTPLSWSDHLLVRFVLESGLSLYKSADPIVWARPRSRMDPDGFLKALGEFPADKTGAPVEALVELWNGEMTRAVDTIAPKRPLPPGRVRSSPWYTPELRAMKRVGRQLEHRWRKSRDESDRTHLRAHYRAYAVAVKAAKKFFSASIASSQCRPVELFRVVQGLVRPGPKEDPMPPSKARCDNFARHFREKIAQIHHELDSTNESEVSGETPMLPSGPKLLEEFQLLRPDDVDKVLGRVLERVVAGQLQALLDETDYLDPFQSGFRPGYSTESALVALYDDLCREKDRGSASLLVLLDLLAAFDTNDHGILLDRLAGLGVGGTALQWFRSYLNGRFQKVVLGDHVSVSWQLCHGVPQGSILSPLLFNIYMKPLGEVIRRCGLRNHQYADDTQLYLSFSTNPGEAVAVLNRCLAEVMEWMRANKLKLNPDKTEVLVGASGFGEGGFDLVLNGATLPLRDKVRSLGVLLDPELSLEAQVTVVARSAFLQLWLINQLRPYLEFNCLAMVTHALVTSRLDFCNALYVGLPLKTVRTLQLVQNRAARLLTGTGRYAHMTPVLRQLHWLPIEARAQFKVLIMTYKALNGLGPGYLNERLRPYKLVLQLESMQLHWLPIEVRAQFKVLVMTYKALNGYKRL